MKPAISSQQISTAYDAAVGAAHSREYAVGKK
jgi:hypothetical protein